MYQSFKQKQISILHQNSDTQNIFKDNKQVCIKNDSIYLKYINVYVIISI